MNGLCYLFEDNMPGFTNPLFKNCWIFETASIKTFAAVAVQLRKNFCCLQWPGFNNTSLTQTSTLPNIIYAQDHIQKEIATYGLEHENVYKTEEDLAVSIFLENEGKYLQRQIAAEFEFGESKMSKIIKKKKKTIKYCGNS